MSWPEDTTFLLIACPTCGRAIGECCISGYSFAVDPHQERREAAAQLDPLICRACGKRCEEDDFYWDMLGTYERGQARRSFRAFIRRQPRPELPSRRERTRQDICGYCTNWGVF